MKVFTRLYPTGDLASFEVQTDDPAAARRVVKEQVPEATIPILAVIVGGAQPKVAPEPA